MRASVFIAAVVALSLLGQPVAAVLCGVRCQGLDARVPPDDHCGPHSTRDQTSSVVAGAVTFCNHDVAIAGTTTERLQILRPAQAVVPLTQLALPPLPYWRERHSRDHEGSPGSSAAPLPLRI